MRILIVTPQQPRTSGNWVTACRYQEGLQELGHEVRVVETGADATALQQEVDTFAPDLVHLLHAYRAGQPWLACRQSAHLPFAVTLTGTDVNHGLDDPQEAPLIEAVLQRAAAIITQNPLTAETLKRDRPKLAARLHYLQPGIVLGSEPYPLRRQHDIPQASVLFLHPAGIRPVKANLELLQLFDPVAAAGHTFIVAFCGPLLDPDYGRSFLAAVADRPWARYLGALPVAAIPAALREVDVVLNNSVSEGLPNALLEAASVGRPMLVRDIPGNAAVVDTQINGLLYGDPEGFARQATALIEDAELRRRLSQPRPYLYAPHREARCLEWIYRQVLPQLLNRLAP